MGDRTSGNRGSEHPEDQQQRARYPNPFLEFSHKLSSDFQLKENHPNQRAWVVVDQNDEIHLIMEDGTDYSVDSEDEHFSLEEWSEIMSLIRVLAEGEFGLELSLAENRPVTPQAENIERDPIEGEAAGGDFIDIGLGPEDEIREEVLDERPDVRVFRNNHARRDAAQEEAEMREPDRDDVSMASAQSLGDIMSAREVNDRFDRHQRQMDQLMVQLQGLMGSHETTKQILASTTNLQKSLLDDQRRMNKKLDRIIEINEQYRRQLDASSRTSRSNRIDASQVQRQEQRSNVIETEAMVHNPPQPPSSASSTIPEPAASGVSAAPSTVGSSATAPSGVPQVQGALNRPALPSGGAFHVDRKYELNQKGQWKMFWKMFSAELRALGLDLIHDNLTAKREISAEEDQKIKDALVHRVDYRYLQHAIDLPTVLEQLRQLRSIKEAETITSSDLAREELKNLRYDPRSETGQQFLDRFETVKVKYAGLPEDSAITEAEIRDAFYSAVKTACPMLQSMKLQIDRKNDLLKQGDPAAVLEIFTLLQMQTVFRNQEATRPAPNARRAALLAGSGSDKGQRCFSCEDNHADHLAAQCPHRFSGKNMCYACKNFVTDHNSQNCPATRGKDLRRGVQRQPGFQARRFNKEFQNFYYNNNHSQNGSNDYSSRARRGLRQSGNNRAHPYNNNNNNNGANNSGRGRGGRGRGRGGRQNRGGRQPYNPRANHTATDQGNSNEN